jgi:hypothetical protein
MKDRFGVARCCCVSFCEDCCNGNAPTEWDVTFDATDSECEICNELIAGTFTLSRTSIGICRWAFERVEPSWQEACLPDYSPYAFDRIYQQTVTIEIRCINETTYRLTAAVGLARSYGSGWERVDDLYGQPRYVQTAGGYFSDYFVYEREVPFDEFVCNAQEDYQLAFSRSSHQRVFLAFFQNQFPSQQYYNEIFDYNGTTPIGQRLTSSGLFYWQPICEPPADLILTAIP